MARRSKQYYSRYEERWPAYVPVAERRRKAELEMAKLRKKGVAVTPVKIEGRVIAVSFWGKAWCDNLESYHDYANRLERGRTYVRNGSVVDLQIAPREVTATVSGSELYQVKVSIGDVAKAHWKSICSDCTGGIDSLVELLQGRFSKGVMERICRQGTGLFPKPSEIRFSCSCPDYASMCKHVAAVLYGVGARLDAQPELLFRLRAVDENELVANIGDALPLSKRGPAAGRVLEADDMSALFGLDMAGAEEGKASPEQNAGAGAGKSGGARLGRTNAPSRSTTEKRPPVHVKLAANASKTPTTKLAAPVPKVTVAAIVAKRSLANGGTIKPVVQKALAAKTGTVTTVAPKAASKAALAPVKTGRTKLPPHPSAPINRKVRIASPA